MALLSWETGRLKCRGLGGGGEDDPVSSEVFLILEVGSGGGGEMGVSVNSLLGGGYTMYLSCFLVLPFSCCKTTKANLFRLNSNSSRILNGSTVLRFWGNLAKNFNVNFSAWIHRGARQKT